jgi:hypothetical protein
VASRRGAGVILRGGVKAGSSRATRWTCFWTACIVFGAIWISGCDEYQIPYSVINAGTSAGGSATNTFITLSPGGIVFVDTGKTRVITATVSEDPDNQGVTWQLIGSGSLSNITTTSITYNAPTSTNTPATIYATSVYDTTQVAMATVYTVPPPSFVTTTLPSGTVGVQYTQTISAQNGAVPFNWSIPSGNGSLPPGTAFSNTGLLSGTMQGVPTTAGTYNFTIQIVDVCGVTIQQQFSVTIAAASSSNDVLANGNALLAQLGGGGVNNSMLAGNYAFEFGGTTRSGAIASAGDFSADGHGNITNGTIDRISPSGAQTGLAFTGTYAIGPNQLGEMTLKFSDGTSASYALAVSSSGARFIEFDDATGLGSRGSGQMKQQNAASIASGSAAGSYAFELSGVDAQGGRMAVAGQFTSVDGGSLNAGVADVNDAGTMTNNSSLTGSYALSPAGPGTAALALAGFGTVHLNLYAVSADEAFAVETDGEGMPLLVGSLARQIGGPFSAATFTGTGVAQLTGYTAGAVQLIYGLMNADGAGNASLAAAQIDGSDVIETEATYTARVTPAGRATLSGTNDADPPILYLVTANEGFLLGTDASVMTGWLQPQTTAQISTATFNGLITGASMFPAGATLTQSVTALSFDGNGDVASLTATSGPSGLALLPTQQGTYSASSSDVFLQLTWPPQSPQTVLIVSPKKLIVIPVDENFAPVVVQQ